MNTTIIRLTIMAALVLTFVGCSQDEEASKKFDLNVTQVQSLYEPDNGKDIVLHYQADTPPLRFAWEPAMANDNGMVLYEIAFDKIDGDFSKPVARFASNNNGAYTYSTIAHKQMNKIALAAGIGTGQTGTFKWTVFSSKGINPVKAAQERTITIKRLSGFADMPARVYLTGAGSEAGTDLSKALVMKQVDDGEFEIYTRLTAGQPFKYVDATSGASRTFYVDNSGAIKEDATGTTTINKTGVYHVYLDFNAPVCTYREITRVSLFLNWSQKRVDLSYTGLGVWNFTNYTMNFGLSADGNNSDDRYKFRMTTSAGESEWRSLLSNDSKPGATPAPSYYYMVEKFNVTQWTNGEIWKHPMSLTATDGWDGKTYNVSFILKGDSPYTHTFSVTK